jgi:hypothetical protein
MIACKRPQATFASEVPVKILAALLSFTLLMVLPAVAGAKQLFTENSSEYIPFEQPAFVVDAIHEAWEQSK